MNAPTPEAASPGEPAVLDTAVGLANIGHRPDTYATVLRLFAAQHRDDASRLQQLLATGDRATLSSLAHALRGAAGSVGALRLVAAAGRLESACHDAVDGPLDEAVAEVATALQAAVAAMQAHPTAAPVPPDDGPNRPAAQLLSELRDLLRHGDMAAADLIAQQRTVLRDLLGARLEALEAHVQRFDHDAALTLLAKD